MKYVLESTTEGRFRLSNPDTGEIREHTSFEPLLASLFSDLYGTPSGEVAMLKWIIEEVGAMHDTIVDYEITG